MSIPDFGFSIQTPGLDLDALIEGLKGIPRLFGSPILQSALEEPPHADRFSALPPDDRKLPVQLEFVASKASPQDSAGASTCSAKART